MWGAGGDGVLDKGKLATSLLVANERIEPKGWSGESCTAGGPKALKSNNRYSNSYFLHKTIKLYFIVTCKVQFFQQPIHKRSEKCHINYAVIQLTSKS